MGSIPSRYQEPLLSAANDLAHRLTPCTEPKPEKKDEEHGKKRGHKKHKDEQ